MSENPIIGITTYGRDANGSFYLPAGYVDAVRQAGGLPVLMTPGEKDVKAAFQLLDGIIFAGGGDLNPATYGGKTHPTIARVDDERDAFEIELANVALAESKPVLGICRGFQLLNVVAGGDLVPDLREKVGLSVAHRTESGGEIEHGVELAESCRLRKIIGKGDLTVVSMHHQALDRVGSGWRVVGNAADRLVEALEYERHLWAVAVLWHPELALQDPNQQKLFKAFITEARRKQA